MIGHYKKNKITLITFFYCSHTSPFFQQQDLEGKLVIFDLDYEQLAMVTRITLSRNLKTTYFVFSSVFTEYRHVWRKMISRYSERIAMDWTQIIGLYYQQWSFLFWFVLLLFYFSPFEVWLVKLSLTSLIFLLSYRFFTLNLFET